MENSQRTAVASLLRVAHLVACTRTSTAHQHNCDVQYTVDISDIRFLVNRYLAWSLGDADVEEFFSWTHVFDLELLTERAFDVGYYCDVS
jgi:hypothetical protein